MRLVLQTAFEISPGASKMTDEDAGEPQRFGLDLFIVHPTLTPEEITEGLGLLPKFVHPVGQPRKTPKGTQLEGVYPDTRWRHCRSHETINQWFVQTLADFVEELRPRKAFLNRLRSTGGKAQVIIKFLGDGYFGDTIPLSTLSLLLELGLDLGLEVFMIPQNAGAS
jgi:hypothetical protein